jgi:hypothetical protein
MEAEASSTAWARQFWVLAQASLLQRRRREPAPDATASFTKAVVEILQGMRADVAENLCAMHPFIETSTPTLKELLARLPPVAHAAAFTKHSAGGTHLRVDTNVPGLCEAVLAALPRMARLRSVTLVVRSGAVAALDSHLSIARAQERDGLRVVATQGSPMQHKQAALACDIEAAGSLAKELSKSGIEMHLGVYGDVELYNAAASQALQDIVQLGVTELRFGAADGMPAMAALSGQLHGHLTRTLQYPTVRTLCLGGVRFSSNTPDQTTALQRHAPHSAQRLLRRALDLLDDSDSEDGTEQADESNADAVAMSNMDAVAESNMVAAAALSACLPGLQELDLAGTDISGGRARRLLDALPSRALLRRVDASRSLLCYNKIDRAFSEVCAALADSQQLQELDLTGLRYSQKVGFAACVLPVSLQLLRVGEVPARLVASFAETLRGCPQLRQLYCTIGTGVRADQTSALEAVLSELQQLQTVHCNVASLLRLKSA